MKKRIALYLLIFSLILVAPLIQGHHTLIDNSSDIKAHTAIIQSIIDGNGVSWFMYAGQPIVAYPLAVIIKLTGIDVRTAYLWFNYLALIGVALSLFFVLRKLVGKNASWLSVPVVMFCSVNILALFTYGVIFNVINMCIILPWTLYFVVKWIIQKRWPYLVASIIMLCLFFTFHATGLYLPFAMAVFFGVAIFYRIFKGQYASFSPIVILFILVLVVGMVVMLIGFGTLMPIKDYVINNGLSLNYDPINLLDFIKSYVGYLMVILFAIGAFGYITLRKNIKLTIETKLFGLLLICFVVPLIAGMVINVSGASVRFALDLSYVIALLVVCLLGILMDIKGLEWFRYTTLVIVISGTAITLLSWLSRG